MDKAKTIVVKSAPKYLHKEGKERRSAAKTMLLARWETPTRSTK